MGKEKASSIGKAGGSAMMFLGFEDLAETRISMLKEFARWSTLNCLACCLVKNVVGSNQKLGHHEECLALTDLRHWSESDIISDKCRLRLHVMGGAQPDSIVWQILTSYYNPKYLNRLLSK